MLQFIHRFEKTLFAFVFLFLAGISLAGLGVGTSQFGGHSNNPQGAASVNGEEISFADLNRARNNGQIPAQQALDSLVDRTLMKHFSERAGLAAGEGAIRQTLQELAPGGMTAQGLQEMLASLRMSPLELEQEIQKESVSRQLYAAISAAIAPSEKELTQEVREFETIKTVVVATMSPEALISQTAKPEESKIEEYYKEQTSDFEIPPALTYDYVLFTPERYRDSVTVTDEDIELYYADNQKEFAIPATVEAKHIRMLYPKDAKPEALNAIKDQAQRAYSRAKAGESFDALALEFSDDLTTKVAGGNLGIVARGKMSPEFDAAAFKLKEPGLADLIEADYGFQIVLVTAVHPESTKPLNEVKDEIRAKIQKVEAPAYASARAGELLVEWKKAGGSLKAFSESRGLAVASSGGALTMNQDPKPELKGMTAAVFSHGDEAQQQIELENLSALVEVIARRDTEVAVLDAVKPQIIKTLQLREANTLLHNKAGELSKVSFGDFEKTARASGFTTLAAVELKNQDQRPPESLRKGNLLSKLRAHSATGVLMPVFDNGSAYVAAIVAVKEDPSVKAEQRKTHRQIVAQQIRYDLGSLVEKTLLAEEKRTAKIEIQPGAYAEE